MANDLSAYVPKILAAGLKALRKQAFLPMLVNRQYEREAGLKGSTITIPIGANITVQDVSPSYVPPSTTDLTPTTTTIALDQWKEAPFYLTDKELGEINDGYVPDEVERAMIALSDTINTAILAKYKDFYGYVGSAGTTPFTTDEQAALDARKTLHDQLAPFNPRVAVLDTAAEAKALKLDVFKNAAIRGDQGAGLREGMLARTLGFDWFAHQGVPTHTAGTITTGLIAKASTVVAVGATTVVATTAASTGACALKTGDIILFAGQTQTYVLTADATQASAATDVSLSIYPGLKTALAGSEAITVKASHVANLAMHRDAIAFATRPLQDDGAAQLGAIIRSITDPESRVTFRLEIRREHKRTRYSFDVLYGIKTVRPELGVRIAG